ncbi:MAG: hypothetical protein ABR616_13665 [Dermatophilaceae bacterium]
MRLVHAAAPSLVTIPNVELLEVGEDWETSTGSFSWTRRDLESAIASQDDPGVRTPIVKLGHVDPRFDGQPSLGRIKNLRLTNNGQTLVGDLVGIPSWLGQVMASAYPKRSIEGGFDYTSRTGNTWSFVLTGVALLGDSYPAITTLDDIEAMWGGEPPVMISAEEMDAVAASSTYFRAVKAHGGGSHDDRSHGNHRKGGGGGNYSAKGVDASSMGSVVKDFNSSEPSVLSRGDHTSVRKGDYVVVGDKDVIAGRVERKGRNKSVGEYVDVDNGDTLTRVRVSQDNIRVEKRDPSEGVFKYRDDINGFTEYPKVSSAEWQADVEAMPNIDLARLYWRFDSDADFFGSPEGLREGAEAAGIAADARAAADSIAAAFTARGGTVSGGVRAALRKRERNLSMKVTASTTVDDIRKLFYATMAKGQEFWWVREVRLDPLELIIDDDEGGLFRVPVSMEGNKASFGQIQPVRMEYVAATSKMVAASWRGPSQAGRPRKSKRPGANVQGSSMQLSDAALRKLGLDPEAELTDEDIEAAVLALDTGESDDSGESAEDTEDDASEESEDDGAEVEDAPAPEQAAATIPDGFVLMDKATLADLQSGVAAARRIEQEQRETEQRQFLENAVRAGKFPRARLEHYKQAWAADPQGTRELITKLSPGLVPLAEVGSVAATLGGGDDTEEQSGYPANWRNRVEATRRGASGRIKVVGD